MSLGQISQGATPYQVVPRDQDAELRAQLFEPSVQAVPAAVAVPTSKLAPTLPAHPLTDVAMPAADLSIAAPVSPTRAFARFDWRNSGVENLGGGAPMYVNFRSQVKTGPISVNGPRGARTSSNRIYVAACWPTHGNSAT